MSIEEPARVRPISMHRLATAHVKSTFKDCFRPATLAISLMIGVSLMEGFGLTMLLPLMRLVGLNADAQAGRRIDQLFNAFLGALHLEPTLLTVLLCFVAITALEGLLTFVQASFTSKLVYHHTAVLRRRLYDNITSANWLFFCRRRSSEFVHALTDEIDRIGAATYALLTLISGCLLSVIYLGVAVRLSPQLSALVLVAGALLMLSLKRRSRVAALTGEQFSVAYRELVATTTEHLGAMRTSKSYGAEDRNRSAFEAVAGRLAKVGMASDRNHAVSTLVFSIGSVVILAVTVYTAFNAFAAPAAHVLMLIFLFSRTMPRLSGIQRSYQNYLNMLPAFAAVQQMQEACAAAEEAAVTTAEPVRFSESLELRDIYFNYDRGSQTGVSGLNISIQAGRTTAIVGPSGAGKSTIADLIMGLISPSQGALLIDRERLTPERVAFWRRCVGYVNQDAFLFHDTVRANLLWAHPQATDEELHQALELASAKQFIASLPEGIETVIGDRGVLLSGGEKQRIALARALLRKPLLLILDEATSALDPENEQQIATALAALHGTVSVLLITHRLANVRHADSIYLIDRGRLVEQGNWAELVAEENGRFRSFCRAQGVIGEITAPVC